jgi:hypothetical protein
MFAPFLGLAACGAMSLTPAPARYQVPDGYPRTRGALSPIGGLRVVTTSALAPSRLGGGAALAGLGLLALVAAGCGGNPTAAVAHIGSTTTAPAAAPGGGGVPTPGHLGADLEKYSWCMRAKGVTNFPNPVVSAQSVSLELTPAGFAGLNWPHLKQ